MRLVEAFKALGDDSRFRLVHLLSKGFFNVQELTTALDLSQSTVSHHLKILQSNGLVRQHREGTWNYYTLNPEENGFTQNVLGPLLTYLERSPEKDHQDLVSANARIARSLLDRRQQQSHTFFETVAPHWKTVQRAALRLDEHDEPSEFFYRKLSSRIGPDETVLELGCGSGAFLEQITPRPGKTVAVDYSPAMIEEAKRNLAARAISVDFRLGFLEHLPLGDESVDRAIAGMVLHHLPSPQEALADVARVLKPGGTLLVLDLTAHGNDHMREQFADVWLGFEPHQLEQWLESVGFRNTQIQFLGEKKKLFLLETTKEKGEENEE